MTETKPKRRWLRFSLATFLLAITAICIWLGLETNRVRARTAITRLVLEHDGMIDGKGHIRQGGDYHTGTGDHPDRLPLTWKILGIKPIHLIMIPIGEFTTEERRKIRAAFPELDNECLGFGPGE